MHARTAPVPDPNASSEASDLNLAPRREAGRIPHPTQFTTAVLRGTSRRATAEPWGTCCTWAPLRLGIRTRAYRLDVFPALHKTRAEGNGSAWPAVAPGKPRCPQRRRCQPPRRTNLSVWRLSTRTLPTAKPDRRTRRTLPRRVARRGARGTPTLRAPRGVRCMRRRSRAWRRLVRVGAKRRSRASRWWFWPLSSRCWSACCSDPMACPRYAARLPFPSPRT